MIILLYDMSELIISNVSELIILKCSDDNTTIYDSKWWYYRWWKYYIHDIHDIDDIHDKYTVGILINKRTNKINR